jgi:glycosyltransferase involved in cell wall biosynthesis
MGAPESGGNRTSRFIEARDSVTLPPAGVSARKKIAYIRRGNFSNTNPRISEQLRRVFPDCEIEEIDVTRDILRRHEGVVLANFFQIIRRYWRALLTRRQTVFLAFYRTPFIFHKIRELVRANFADRAGEFAFSLQSQSLYDASIPGVPHFVYTDHTHLANLSYPGFPRDQLFTREWIDLEQEVYRHACHVFVMGNHVRRSLIDDYAHDPARATCVYAGSNIDPAPVPLANDNYANQTVIFVGIDWARKGGPTLLAAFDSVAQRMPHARLVIIGSTPSTTHPCIEVLGRVSREEVKRRLIEASVFCLPTRAEPFGIAVIEAFHHCLPVVASNIGAIADFVRDGESGRLVPPDDPAALADALTALLSDPVLCRRLGERGHAIAREHYSWDAVGDKLRAGILAGLANTSA